MVDLAFTKAPSWIKNRYEALLKSKISSEPRFLFLKKKEEEPLWKRGIHVPVEGHQIELYDRGEMLDVEYVIQEHLADKAGRHFDLRLVIDGVSVSWAIPMKGKREGLLRMPSTGERWIAIRQPDHTVEYNSFDGEIPRGNLGAGLVKIWAKGRCDVHKIEDGHVHFEIHSGPAKGRYVLVNTDGTQGLILRKKPEAVDVWTKPRYTKKPEEFLEGPAIPGHAAERKVDGAAIELRIGEGGDRQGIRAFSHRISRRTGVLIEHTDRLELPGRDLPRELDGTRLRGEAWHPRGVDFLSGTLNSGVERARQLQKRAGPVRVDIFDITHYKGKDVQALPYAERRALYEEVVKALNSKTIQPVRQVRSNFSNFYRQQVNLKGAPTDGVVVKDLSAAYNAKPWIKVKPSDLADCIVLQVDPGTGKYRESLGAIVVQTPEGKQVRVGSGFSDWERRWIWNHRSDLAGETARVAFHVRGGDRTATGPRFDSWHPDKSDLALKMYAEALSDDPSTVYKLKSSAGWRPK